jgi:pimeloyl-ACP methyl ester carboxylesterase
MTEHAVLIAAQSLVGVLTDAEIGVRERRQAIVFLNAGLLHRVGPNRLYVRMARELAHHGFASLRFDRSGVGDSLPRRDGLSLHAAALGDVQDALDFVGARYDVSSFILVGLCSGADLAFRAAMCDERVVGTVLIDGLPYETVRSRLYHYASRLMQPGGRQRLFARDGPLLRALRCAKLPARGGTAFLQRDVPPREEAEATLCELTKRGARLLLIYTPGREYSYRSQFRDMFPNVRGDNIEVAFFEDVDHTFTLRASQDLLVRTVDRWISTFQ